MSWESTIEYYRLVNELVAERLGGLHSADCLLRSVDFAEIEVLQRESRWAEAGTRLAQEAQALGGGGRGAARPVHEHDAQARGRDRARDHDPVRPHRRHHRRRGARRGVGARRPARDRLHDGAGLLRRAAALRARARRARAGGGRPAGSSTTSSTRSCASGSCATPRATSTGGSCGRWPTRAPRASCSAAPRSICWSGLEDSPVPVFDTTRLHAERAVTLALAP